MKKDPLFFIALLPPAALQAEVTAFKQYIAQTWGASHALKSPPHLTLQPPFAWPAGRIQELTHCLRAFALTQHHFPIALQNFGAFPPRVVFVQPVMDPALDALFQQLKHCLSTQLQFSDPRNDRPFHPHMTVAHRDLEEMDFPAVWQHFRRQSYERTFDAAAIALLESIHGKWEVKELFPFQ